MKGFLVGLVIVACNLAGCNNKLEKPVSEQLQQPKKMAVAVVDRIDAEDFQAYKQAVAPTNQATEWSESSLLNWSTFTMDFPDDDHVAKQFADAFAARPCRLTAQLRDDVEMLTEQWLHQHAGHDDVAIKKHGLEIAVGGYRDDGLIRMKLAFTIDQK